MILYNNYQQIEKKALAKNEYLWKNVFESFHNKTIHRLNWILIYDNKLLVTKEIYGSQGALSWNYILDEWCFLANCMDIYGIKNYYGIPPLFSNILQDAMENLSFVLNSSLIYDQLKDIYFSEKFTRTEKDGIDLVDTYAIFDFGVNEVKTSDIDKKHNPEHQWISINEIDNLPLHNVAIVKEIIQEYGSC